MRNIAVVRLSVLIMVTLACAFSVSAFAFADDAVYLLHRQSLPSSLAYPAAATSQIAGLGDGNHVEGREEWFPPLLSPFKLPHIP
jgi:hypothetical protein